MGDRMSSYSEEAKETREKVDKLYSPPPLNTIKYLIIDKRLRARYYIRSRKAFLKRKEQIQKEHKDYKERFVFIKQKV